MRVREVTVRVTHNCNKACSYCHSAEDMKNKTKHPNLILPLAQLLSTSKELVNEFVISGGEPLLEWEETLKIILAMVSYNPNCNIELMTNGTLIDDKKVEILNQIPNVRVSISLDYNSDGEKSVENLIKTANSFDIVTYIRALQNKRIKMVIPRFDDDRIPLGVVNIQRLFDCQVYLMPDYTNVHNWDISDIYYTVECVSRITALSEVALENIRLSGFWCGNCNCSESKIVMPDGSIREKAHEIATDGEDFGCSNIANRMQPGLYKLYVKVIREVFKDSL